MDDINKFLEDIDGTNTVANGGVKSEANDYLEMLNGGTSEENAFKKSHAVNVSSSSKPACGCTMPKFRREGLVVFVTYPDDMESIPGNGQRRQELSAARVFEV